MVYLSLSISLIVVFKCIYWEYKKSSPVFFFYCCLLFVFYVPFSISYVFESKYPEYVYIIASAFSLIYISIFSLSLWFIRNASKTDMVWSKVFNIKCQSEIRSTLSNRVPVILAMCSIFGFIISLKLFSFSAFFNLNWWDLVNSNNPLTLFSTYLAYSSAGILPLAIFKFQNGKFDRLASIIVIIWIAFATFVLQTRSFLLIFMFPGIAYLFLHSDQRKKLISWVLIPAAAILYIGARAVRHAGSFEAFLVGDISSLFVGASEGSEQSLFDAFLHFIYIDNHFPGFGENITLQRVVFFAIPPLKPEEFSYIMHSAYFGYVPKEGLSMHPTIFGDAWGNSGYLGALIYSILLSVIVHIIERIVKISNNPVIIQSCFGILTVTLLIFARGAVYNAFMFTFLPITIVIFSTLLLTKLKSY